MPDIRLVLINEAHHVARHRATTRSLLKPLHELGFRYFAFEALKEDAKTLQRRGYPIASTGSYVNEPEFGALVRKALQLGYLPVAYEAVDARDVHARERGQAENLAAVLEREPDAKILVHVGYQHIDESGLLFGARTMAQRLKEMTGIDPLTINQSTLTWIGEEMPPNSLYADAIEKIRYSEPFILKSDHKPWSLEPAKYDISVITPPSGYHDDRLADWQVMGRRTIKLPVPANARLLEARLRGEADDAVPLVRALVDDETGTVVTIALEVGDYRLRWANADNQTVHTREQRVKER